MAFAAVASTKEPRAVSLGVIKIEIQTYTAADDDVAGTITASRITNVMHCFIDGGLVRTAADVISGKTVTVAFADPGAGGLFGNIILIGV